MKLNLIVFSQTDTSKVKDSVKCLTTSMFKKIAQDLVKGDSALAMLEISNQEILKLEQKIVFKDTTINIMKQKENNYNEIIKINEDKINILQKDNETLSSHLKKEKNKNKFRKLISNSIIVSLVTLLILK